MPVRLIVRRVKPTPGSQLALIANYSCHAFITVWLELVRQAGGDLESVPAPVGIEDDCDCDVVADFVNGKESATEVPERTEPELIVPSTDLLAKSVMDDTPVVPRNGNNGVVALPNSKAVSNIREYMLEAIDGSEIVIPQGGSDIRDWSRYNKGKVMERHVFGLLLADLCSTIPDREPAQTGRPAWKWDRIVANICRKVYLTNTYRGSTSKEQLEAEDPAWSNLIRYMSTPELTEILLSLIEKSAAPFRVFETVIAVDSTGFATSVRDNYNVRRYGNSERSKGEGEGKKERKQKREEQPAQLVGRKRARFVKAHIASPVRSNVVAAVYASTRQDGDAPQLPGGWWRPLPKGST